MIFYRDYAAGWLDSSVGSFLGDFPSTYDRAKYSLITCIDSDTNPSSAIQNSPELVALQPVARTLGRGILVPTKRLLEVNHDSPIFFGFDEIWFFPDTPIEPKPASSWLVGPPVISKQTFEQLGDWMMENSCSLALGDGVGLNLIVKASGLVRNLIGQSIKQVLNTSGS